MGEIKEMMKGLLLFIAFACVASAARSDCWTCKKVVTVARSLEGSNEDRMDRVCDNVFAWMKDKCAQIVDRYYDEIVGSDDLDAAQVCADVCQPSLVKLVPAIADMEVMTEPLVKLQPAQTSPLVKLQPAVKPAPLGIGCTICTLIVGYAEDKLESNATLAEIETFLNTTVCGLLPSFLRPECAALVDEYAPQIAQKIMQGYPASVICEDVGLCSKNKAQVLAKPLVKLVPAIADMEVKTELLVKLQPAVKPAPEGIGCTICTLIVGYAEDKLESNATLAEIETFLNTTVCGLLPSFLRPECAALVDEYAPQIAQKIMQGYPASVICKDIHLCSSSKAVVKPELMMKLQPATNSIECAVCRLVI